jgi:hypothetical protein
MATMTAPLTKSWCEVSARATLHKSFVVTKPIFLLTGDF